MTKTAKAPKGTPDPSGRASNSVFRFGTGTMTASIGGAVDSPPPPSSRASVSVVLLRLLLRNLKLCAAAQKPTLRQQISAFVTNVGNPECIDDLLLFCTTEAGPDGLDTAIDILSKTGDVVLAYAWEYLCRDVAKWTPETARAYKPNDDHWYILLRAVARTKADAAARYSFIKCCMGAESRGVREGVVEALGDFGTPKAREALKRLARDDSDPFIRRIAAEALTDLES